MFAPEKSVQNKTLSVDTGLHLGYIFLISSYGDEKSSPPKPSYCNMRALLFSEGVTLCHCICLCFGRCLAAHQAGATTLRLRPKAFRFGSLSMIYEVFLDTGESVFLSGKDTETTCVLVIEMKKFWELWLPSQRDERLPSHWFLPKYNKVSEAFSISHMFPVPVPTVGDPVMRDGRLTVSMVDGATRIQWLYDHGVTSFPIEVTTRFKDSFLASSEEKSM